ncbi:MAG: AraC family transcriptional regulator [Elusimicrobia bacterium]|nr:AraC family transcriptional regulator [Elusimicrobiota bacterium]
MKIDKYRYPFPEKDFPFRIRTTNNIIDLKGSYHVHPFTVEFHYIRSGNGYYFIKDRRYSIKEKSLLIIHGQDIHTYRRKENQTHVDQVTLFFSNSLFKKYSLIQPIVKKITTCHNNFPHQLFFNEKEAIGLELTLDTLQKEWKNKKVHYQEVIINNLTTFLIQLIRIMSKKKKNISSIEEHNHIIDEVLDYIDKHYKERVTLSGLSKHVGYSPYHISHLFKKFTGFNFKESIANRRVLEAKRILETDNSKKIISIAYEVGFSNLVAFNRNFRRLTDTTPSLYRKFVLSIHK